MAEVAHDSPEEAKKDRTITLKKATQWMLHGALWGLGASVVVVPAGIVLGHKVVDYANETTVSPLNEKIGDGLRLVDQKGNDITKSINTGSERVGAAGDALTNIDKKLGSTPDASTPPIPTSSVEVTTTTIAMSPEATSSTTSVTVGNGEVAGGPTVSATTSTTVPNP